MIDSHCHLADTKFSSDLPEVVARAETAGVSAMITIADTLEEGERCLGIAAQFDQIFCTIGVHPHHSSQWSVGSRQKLVSLLASSKKVVALGEIGLDYHYMRSPKGVQMNEFREQLLIAKELDLPAVVHNRESIGELRSIINDEKPSKLVLHCCTEQWKDVADFVERGYLLSFTGIATFPKSGEIRETIRQCPLECMMIETDAPYLAPEKYRGQRNEPAFVVEVAECIAEVKGVSFEEVDRVTTKTTKEFFGLPS